MAALNGRPDAIVFTDAIGEDEPLVRSRACEPFKFIGVEVDLEKNAISTLDSDISLPNTPVRVLIVKSREDWQIARECHEIHQSKPARRSADYPRLSGAKETFSYQRSRFRNNRLIVPINGDN